ncbi:P-loop NTPase fold protein [Herbaspirillum huttiense F1]|uniref:KAP family P-loop NTPase fold protein n=1 Tax=Herbaspirillum huttiense TaxID=863372 RepID=UPI0028858989|nr:P-loop NTPase fold protein [Herbaspirillum huttiense]MDT0354807.1 P-loop NTPase fold protein [Herbaspirillum huttiense F1]
MASKDLPFLHSDTPQTKVDVYGRKPFALQLARLLNLPPESPGIVVGIEGAWGSGKSTVIRYLIESLSTEVGPLGGQPIVIEFNPWMLSGADALVEALLTQLAAGIGANHINGKGKGKEGLQAAQKVLGYVSLLRHLKYLKYVPGASLLGVTAETVGGIASTATDISQSAGEASEEARKIAKEAEELIGNGLTLVKKKREVANALATLERGILVVVDDLDRLTPAETKSVFQTIKALADFPRVAYLLAYDRKIVANGLGDGDDKSGGDYLEKIVQVSYPISPAFSWQFQGHLTTLLEQTFARIERQLVPFELELLDKAKAVACILCRHPRDVVRLVNRLTLSLAATTGEVNAADVIVAEALFQRFPSIREAIFRNPQNYTGSFFNVLDDIAATDWSMYYSASKEERRQAWMKDVPEDSEGEFVKQALAFLFPMLSSGHSHPVHHRRLSQVSRLIRFLALTSVNGVQDVAEIEHFLKFPIGLGAKLAEYPPAEALEFVSHVSSYIEGIQNIPYEALIPEFMEACTVQNSLQSSSFRFSRVMAEVVAGCLAKIPNAAGALLQNFVKNTPLVYGMDLLVMVGMPHGEVRGVDDWKISQAPKYIEDATSVAVALANWRERSLHAFESSEIVQQEYLFAILYGLAKVGRESSDRVALNAFKKLCTSVHDGLKYFLSLAKPHREYQSELFYLYVWDADEMAQIIETSEFATEFKWYSDVLRTDTEVRAHIANRAVS